ncbi:MAG TPA: PCMD domain-containing protein [Prolixibacteraceae bacterium]|nr:PCMD domain-containing protein [Prolixibacteraceae bacterium]
MLRKKIKFVAILGHLLFLELSSFSQNIASIYTDSQGQLNYSSLDLWYARKVKESFMLSGKIVDLYGLGVVNPNSDFFDTKLKDTKSPWGTTNIYSKMVLDVANTRVIPEKRGNGYCARLETGIRKDNIAGLKVEVLIAGTLFVGEMIEPVRGLKDPLKNVSQGIPFNRKPKAVKFDYKYRVGNKRVKATYGVDAVDGPDKAEFCLILQKRWEDKDGNVLATRIGGARQFFTGSVDQWINSASFPVFYGDITRLPEYDVKTMGLIPSVGEVYVKNSRGKMVPLVETGWGKPEDTPTHLIFYFTSSYQGIQYQGSPESVFWVDNIEFVY